MPDATLPVGSLCGIVELVTSAGGSPLHITTTYVLTGFLPIVETLDPHEEWFSLYARAGVELGSTDHAIESSVAAPIHASLLDIEPGHPLLLLERLVHDSDGTPVEYAFTRIRGDRLTLRQRLSREPRTRPPA